jgi:hypothetical protein
MRIKALIPIAALLVCGPAIAVDGKLSPRFRTVYVLEMTNGLDQYLSNRLTSARVMWVVLEPTSADAVLTESLDEPFWSWLARTYPRPASATPAAPATSAASGTESAPQGSPEGRGPVSAKQPMASSKRPGMVFLVDPRRRVVLWAAWENPKNPSAIELGHSAERIANQLKAAFEK